ADDAFLVSGGQPGKDAGGAGGGGQVRVVHRLDLRAEQDVLYRHAHLLADVGGDDLVVAGEDLHVHAQAVKALQCLCGGVFGRVEEGQETQQDQVRLILDRIHRLIGTARHLLVSYGDHAKALAVQSVRQLPAFGVVLGQNLDDLAFDFHPGALAQHFLHRALADQRVQPGVIFHHHRHAPADEVERYLVYLVILLVRPSVLPHFLMFEDRFVEQVLQPGMVEAVEVAILQDLVTGITVHVEMLFEDDLALGERAGLVGAQDIHRAEVLDGVEAFHDDFLAGHGQGALGQVDGHDHGQHLGGQPDGYGHGKQEGFHPVVLAQPVDEEHRRNHHGDEADHQPGELVDAQVEAGQLALPDDAGGQRAKVGPVPGVDDNGGRGAALHVGAQEADVGKFQRILNGGRRLGGFLLHRQ